MTADEIRQQASELRQTLLDVWRQQRQGPQEPLGNSEVSFRRFQISQASVLNSLLFELVCAGHTWVGEIAGQLAALNDSLREVSDAGQEELPKVAQTLQLEHECPDCKAKQIFCPALAPLIAVTRPKCFFCGAAMENLSIELDPLQLKRLGYVEPEKSTS
jgi:hypothetical protein